MVYGYLRNPKKFLHKIIGNLQNSKNDFIVHYHNKYSYKNTYEKLKRINFFLNKFKKKKIALFSDKSYGYYLGVLGIVLSGNTWVQIYPSIPKNRIKNIIQTSKIKLAIIDPSFPKQQIPKMNTLKKLFIKKMCSQKKEKNFDVKRINMKDVSMIFFTSGSTGKPKGVKISYKGFISSAILQIKNLKYREKKEIFSDYHDTSFVMSLNIIFPAIFLNSSIAPMINSSDKLNPVNHLKKNKVSVLITVPSFLFFIKKNLINSKLKISKVILCGENFPSNLLKFIKNNIKYDYLFNSYGATELSPWAFSYMYKGKDAQLISKAGQVPIGKPYEKIIAKISKKNELLISGPILSLGYLNSQSDTKFKFFNGKKFYNTGDIVKKIQNLHFCIGRQDTIIKLKGHRIDLVEIETLVKKLVKANYVFCFLKKKRDPYLVIIINTDKKKSEINLRTSMSKYLPNYMIPKSIHFENNLKFNKNGKIDKTFYRTSFN